MAQKLHRLYDVWGFGSGHLRVGDLNGDGIAEFLLPQDYPQNREIFCLTAMDQDGNILWQYGKPHPECNHVFSDIPVQIYDWDCDGRNEVLFIRQAIYEYATIWRYSTASYLQLKVEDYDDLRWNKDYGIERSDTYIGPAQLVILDGATGEEKYVYDIPASADDCLAIGFFDGTGKPNALVKDRYWNLWAISNDGQILWHVSDQE